jgi:hypothetical protein
MRRATTVLILACVSSILADIFALHNSAAIDPGTVAGMWLFDDSEGETAKDSSGQGNDGTLLGPEWVDDGKIGSVINSSAKEYNCR